MSSYKELLAQREKLEKQIEEAKSREYAEVLNEIKQKMADYGHYAHRVRQAPWQECEMGYRLRAGVAPKYRDPESGSTCGSAAANCRVGSPVRIVRSF